MKNQNQSENDVKREQWERPDREAVIRDNPLLEYCQARGWKLKRDGADKRYKCPCPLRSEKTPSFTIYPKENRFHCFGCQKDGNVIDLHAELNGMSGMEAMCDLAGVEYHGDKTEDGAKQKAPAGNGNGAQEGHNSHPRGDSKGTDSKPGNDKKPKPDKSSQREVYAYDYQDLTGRVVFQVVRYAEPKDFRQCRIDEHGQRVWSMDGVERLPYRLPELLAHPASVWIVEGEKDVETMRAIGQTATCNPGGADKWLPAFSQHLRGKCVYLAPDNDEAGQNHMRSVLKSLERIVEWVRWVELPREHNGKPVKDVSDLREACVSEEAFFDALKLLQKKSRLIERGIESRGKTMAELEAAYIANLASFGDASLLLGNWLPALGVRGLGPGDLLGIVAGTGQLKSAAMLNILANHAHLPAVIFNLELPENVMFERCAGIAANIDSGRIEDIYRTGDRVDWRKSNRFSNQIIITDPVTMDDIDAEITRASAKLGCCPKVVAIDYAQLVDAPRNRSRYERVSDTCEQARRLALKHSVIMILISQVHRPDGDKRDTGGAHEVSIHDAKESGSFENSCSLLLGQWKTGRTTLRCKVLKNSRGTSGQTADMDIRGGTYILDPAGMGEEDA